ncbi:hypothetical protein TIFTF001_032695 [Ficus carica]|uniref:RING-CH-type domain-containing protein n=1 Tax=Ficus carica TaxID=3494 RepID=A0AA88J2R6_FICCA|nr:hypothetical protein TIFTF001_032695 [Ficus carica]
MRGENSSSEKISCRICQVSSENLSTNFELIQLGCGCKDGLGTSHHRCAETWFKSKGNRICEICGRAANYMTGIEDTRLVISWSETTMMPSGTNTFESETSCACDAPNVCFFTAEMRILLVTIDPELY